MRSSFRFWAADRGRGFRVLRCLAVAFLEFKAMRRTARAEGTGDVARR
jgi:hypothetical protein